MADLAKLEKTMKVIWTYAPDNISGPSREDAAARTVLQVSSFGAPVLMTDTPAKAANDQTIPSGLASATPHPVYRSPDHHSVHVCAIPFHCTAREV
jgi:hypothetical protein